MRDIELLELASKGANLNVDFDIWTTDGVDVWYGNDKWNPLTDDGDALRLAVKLEFDLITRTVDCDSYAGSHDRSARSYQPHGEDKFSATRRAIVCAAAEIGRNMP